MAEIDNMWNTLFLMILFPVNISNISSILEIKYVNFLYIYNLVW